MLQDAAAGTRVHQEVLGGDGVPQKDELATIKQGGELPPLALEFSGIGIGRPAVTRQQHQTAHDSSKHMAVGPQMQGRKANPGKSGPWESSDQEGSCLSEAVVPPVWPRTD